MLDFVIVTGMSGAGKTKVISVLEDMGYFCMDNMPPQLMDKFLELFMKAGDAHDRVAVVMDVRGGEMFSALSSCLEELRMHEIEYKVLFLDCEDGVLLSRYKETRRPHPLSESMQGSIEEAIATERRLLAPAIQAADYVIDTTYLSVAQLKEKVRAIFQTKDDERMLCNFMSFGFKYGIPNDADLVFDVRFLPNPFYVPELKPLTGLDAPVEAYIMQYPQSRETLQRLTEVLDYLLRQYAAEGRSQLTVAFGCTGGQHRSALFAHRLCEHFKANGYRAISNHRDISKVRP